jgi:ATP-dependent helicase HrpB
MDFDALSTGLLERLGRGPDGEPLPIVDVLPELLAAMKTNPAVVLEAPPGAGKTTVVPPAVLSSGLLGQGQLLMLEPRRLAARASALRIAELLGEPVGRTVGYQIRFESRQCPQTRILVVTEGILTQKLIADPLLEGISCVVLDEFHERSVHLDLALACVRELLEARGDLRLLVMSATLDVGELSRYLGDAPTVSSKGRLFPLQVTYLGRKENRSLTVSTASACGLAMKNDPEGGDLLVFLPGAGEIRRLEEHLGETRLPDAPLIQPLFGALPKEVQDQVLRPGARRRIVLATNIAETSLTLPNITCVVDTGLVKILRHDPRTGMDGLVLSRIGRKNAVQRAGRAGRTGPGRVYRLWTEVQHRQLLDELPPEITRVDLAPVLLLLLALNPGDPRQFPFFDPPKISAIENGLDLLTKLGLLEARAFCLTPLGKKLARLPVHPRIGAMLQMAVDSGFAELGALYGALLQEPDILADSQHSDRTGFKWDEDCDMASRAALLDAFEGRGGTARAARYAGLRVSSTRQVVRAKTQLLSLCRRFWPGAPDPALEITASDKRRLLLSGFGDRVCRRRKPDSADGVMVGGRGVRLADGSQVSSGSLFVALDADAGKKGAHSVSLVRRASRIELDDLRALFPGRLVVRNSARFDREKKVVTPVEQLLFDDLVVDERPSSKVAPEEVARVLAEAASRSFTEIFRPGRELAALIQRIGFAAGIYPQLVWPDVSEPGLGALLPRLALGRRSFDELLKIDWQEALWAELGFEERRVLREQIPEQLEIPSGRKARVDYSAVETNGGYPILAAKIQEFFGITHPPRMAEDRVPLLLHLLAPNGRPAQITSDLAGFWKNGYPQVRKELRARYPKHPWPEDPLTATPTARAKPRRK